ncbi:acetoacetate--CoA ligase [uncultured Jatrophihabitans sp.]|uniref:acetoacetate--CoA ligase n=1 Tax=uncultured Jatrophihabitans sp. TaxID=1610747 RepID=UPI0035CA66A8
MTNEGDLLWEPSTERIAGSRITAFGSWLAAQGGITTATYDELWDWSVADLDAFWSALARWYDVRWHRQPTAALASREMPGARWFPDGTLNYAEHALFPPAGATGSEVADDDVAVVAGREDGRSATLTWAQLREQVASVRTMLAGQGVGVGDRVVGLVPNAPEALVAMLATCSLGAVWSSCSPDFGPQAVSDRFGQIEPTVLVAVDGYVYGGKSYDIRPTVTALRAKLPTLRATVLMPYLDAQATLPDAGGQDTVLSWPDVLATPGTLAFEPVPFDAPLWILYSSGTTGLPKPIVHGHGGILVEHVKQLALHLDLGPGSRFFWFSTTGWMMWNLLVSGLVVGSTIVLFDGNPGYPDLGALWRFAADTGITCFGTSAPYLQACMKAEVRPGADTDLSALQAVGSTGAPLSPEGFAWVYAEVGGDLALGSLSGGTDVCTAFVGSAPTLPVRAGEIACRMLGCAVEAYDESGHPVIGEVGELVITEPMPSMPVAFWNDPDGSRLREAYYDTYPGVWRHGDWIKITDRGSCVIYGRSDSTLNRGGVRMGTAEFYTVVEDHPAVADSLVIDTSSMTAAAAGTEGKLLLFVVPADGVTIDDTVVAELRTRIRTELSPRHVPDEVIVIDAVPRTLNGKKCEVPVKRVLAGVPLERAVSRGALANPEAMSAFLPA